MPSLLAGILVALAVLAVVLQLVLPPYLAGRVEDRLEAGGGSADVDLDAFPALFLLGGRGGSFEAQGTGLRLELGDRRDDPLKRLDGFERVEVRLTDLEAGPVRAETFELTREGRGQNYELLVRATATPQELAGQLGNAGGEALGGLFGSLAGGLLGSAAQTPIPLELRASVTSRDGRPDVAAATGSVAGLPAGPLAGIVLAVVLDRL